MVTPGPQTPDLSGGPPTSAPHHPQTTIISEPQTPRAPTEGAAEGRPESRRSPTLGGPVGAGLHGAGTGVQSRHARPGTHTLRVSDRKGVLGSAWEAGGGFLPARPPRLLPPSWGQAARTPPTAPLPLPWALLSSLRSTPGRAQAAGRQNQHRPLRQAAGGPKRQPGCQPQAGASGPGAATAHTGHKYRLSGPVTGPRPHCHSTAAEGD